MTKQDYLKPLIIFFVYFLFTFFTAFAKAQVWVDTQSWSPEMEAQYSEWVIREWQKDFFSRDLLKNGQTNPYKGLRSDCADTVYSMRLIFSYENRLPFAVQDPTKSGALITNRISRYNHLSSETARVRAFLKEMFDTISTSTLANDTYPVAITAKTVRAGGLMLTTAKNHHSWTIKEILPIGVPWLVYNSTIGAASTSQFKERQSWPNPYWVFENDYSLTSRAGIRDWRPIAYINKPVWQTPGYSDEQYRIGLEKWVSYVQTRIAKVNESAEASIQRLYKTACEGLTMRVEAVKEGVDFVSQNPRCMDYATYDIYSTPNRDRRFFDDLMALRSAYKNIYLSSGPQVLSQNSQSAMAALFPNIKALAANEAKAQAPSTAHWLCPITYGNGQQMDLIEAKRRVFLGLFSNNPHDGMSQRWGDTASPSALAKKCQSWDQWSPEYTGD